jgi:hypothetical protein
LHDPAIESYFNWFFLYFIYNLLLVLPLLLYQNLNESTAIFYVLALFAQGAGAWQAYRAALQFWQNRHHRIFSMMYIIGVTIAALLHAFYLEIPQGSADGNWVMWYKNRAVAFPYIAFMFLAGWTFAWQFLKGFNSLLGLMKARTFFLMTTAFILPFAAFFYHGAQNLTHIYAAFVIAIAGLIMVIIGNNLIGFLHRRK